MMMKHNRIKNGFSLLEMLLVLVIASSLIVMFLNFTTQQSRQQQQNKTAMQMQQVLNAALSFYSQNGRWPSSTLSSGSNGWQPVYVSNELVALNYLPQGTGLYGRWLNGYGNDILTGYDTTANVFYVVALIRNGTPAVATTTTTTTTTAAANIIAGQLPSGMVVGGSLGAMIPPTASSCDGTTTCYAVASVPPPGQNLNNARSVNFGSIYYSGQCVPKPSCPTGMSAQILAVPAQINGLNDSGKTNVYPISSYTAYATTPSTSPAMCDGQANANSSNCASASGGVNNQYWRVCLSITTERGKFAPQDTTDVMNMGTIMVVTRCVPGSPTPNEPTGSVVTFGTYH